MESGRKDLEDPLLYGVTIALPDRDTNNVDNNDSETRNQHPKVYRNLSAVPTGRQVGGHGVQRRKKFTGYGFGVGVFILLILAFVALKITKSAFRSNGSGYSNSYSNTDTSYKFGSDDKAFDWRSPYNPARNNLPFGFVKTTKAPYVMRTIKPLCGRICRAKEQEEAASNILRTMNRSVDPCDNFYEYSCGNWGKVNPQPLGSNSLTWNNFARLDDKEHDVLHGFLMRWHWDDDAKISAGKKFYQDCVGDGPNSLYAFEKTRNPTTFSPTSIDMNIIQKLLPYEERVKINFTELEAKILEDLERLEVNSISDAESETSRRSVCLIVLKTVKGKRLIERLYLKSISIVHSDIRQVSNMMDNIQTALVNLLAASPIPWTTSDSWRDEAASEIRLSLRKVKPCIGYYKELLYDDQFPVILNDLDFIIKALDRVNATEEEIDASDKNTFPTCFWIGSPYEPKAQYNTIGKSIEVTSSLIQSPFFDTNRPMAMNYGAIGVVMGHEVGHAVNIEKYQRKGQLGDSPTCLVHQYGQFTETIPETVIVKNVTIPRGQISLNGTGTLEENFSDNIGLRGAFAAFKALSNYVKITLPGLEEFTEDQLFFLGYAQTWCSDTRPEVIGYQLTEDSHSPEKFRVLGSLRNSKQFASTWECPLGSPMNPVDKCLLFN